MTQVFFESKNDAEVVATFADEKLYLLCLPALQKQARKEGKKVTESITLKNVEI